MAGSQLSHNMRHFHVASPHMAYRGDPAALWAARHRLEGGSPLRVLALSSGRWPLQFLQLLNQSVPAAHQLIHVELESIEATACMGEPLLRKLGHQSDLVLLELGQLGAAHHARTVSLAERLLRAMLGAMSSPSAMFVLRPATMARARLPNDDAVLRLAAHPLTLVAQFYGVPALGGGGGTPTSWQSRDSDDGDDDAVLATAAVQLLTGTGEEEDAMYQVCRDPAACTWALPNRQMLLDGSSERDPPCSASAGALRCTSWRLAGAVVGGTVRGAAGGKPGEATPRQALRESRCVDWISPTRASDDGGGDRGGGPRSRAAFAGPRTRLTAELQRVVAARAAAGLRTFGVDAPVRTRDGGLRQAAPAHPPRQVLNATYGACQSTEAYMRWGKPELVRQCSRWTAGDVLPPRLLQRTVAHDGSAGGWGASWARVVARLDAGANVTVGVLGGSMSIRRSEVSGDEPPPRAPGAPRSSRSATSSSRSPSASRQLMPPPPLRSPSAVAPTSRALHPLPPPLSCAPQTTPEPSWPELLVEWMQRTWPAARVTLHNGAIGATGSTFFAMCAESRLPPAADLIVLEHTLNDAEQAGAPLGPLPPPLPLDVLPLDLLPTRERHP